MSQYKKPIIGVVIVLAVLVIVVLLLMPVFNGETDHTLDVDDEMVNANGSVEMVVDQE